MKLVKYLVGSLIVGLGYTATLIGVVIATKVLAGLGSAAFEITLADYGWTLVSGTLMGFFLGPLAGRMPASRGRHWMVWTGVIFFNLGSVAIEGAYFVSELVYIPLPTLFVQQLIASLAAALLIALIFPAQGPSTDLGAVLRQRSWAAWVWRFIASSLAYLLFYYVFGAINFTLVTEPFYTANAGGLFVPAADKVLLAESIRAPLIILSATLFILSMRTERRRLAFVTGRMLFWIGGLVPLVLQVNNLPIPLLIASGIEIFCQNFLTGVVAVWLLWTPTLSPAQEETRQTVTLDRRAPA